MLKGFCFRAKVVIGDLNVQGAKEVAEQIEKEGG
jgi:hypothetical protein